MANLKSTDLIIVGREGTSYQTTFEDFKDSVFIDSPLGINDVLTENNVADPAQSLHFRITEGDIPPTRTVDTINFDGGSGLRLGGLVSYYHINTPFTVDTGSGEVSEFEYATRQMSTMEDAYFTTNSEGDVFTQVGLWGIRYRDKGTEVYLTQNNIQLRIKDKDNPDNYAFNIEAEAFSGRSSIKADEFIGDGSKLTNLNLTGYATETYVDEAIEELGDILSLKGALDFTTAPAPDVFAVGDVYANTGTGTPDSSWSLSGDVAPGELYGRGETQWALIGSSDVDLSEYAKLVDVNQSITAKEFIGDGSKLTNLPTPDVDAYTKVESDANFIGQDISSLPELPTD